MDDLLRAIVAFREARDWRRFHEPKELAAAIAIEAAELQELFLWGTDWATGPTREQVAEELADIWIFSLTMAADLGIDFDEAIRGKLLKNAAKYPLAES